MFVLTVIHPFGDYAAGQIIDDPATVERVTASAGSRVVRTWRPDLAPVAEVPTAPPSEAPPEGQPDGGTAPRRRA